MDAWFNKPLKRVEPAKPAPVPQDKFVPIKGRRGWSQDAQGRKAYDGLPDAIRASSPHDWIFGGVPPRKVSPFIVEQ